MMVNTDPGESNIYYAYAFTILPVVPVYLPACPPACLRYLGCSRVPRSYRLHSIESGDLQLPSSLELSVSIRRSDDLLARWRSTARFTDGSRFISLLASFFFLSSPSCFCSLFHQKKRKCFGVILVSFFFFFFFCLVFTERRKSFRLGPRFFSSFFRLLVLLLIFFSSF